MPANDFGQNMDKVFEIEEAARNNAIHRAQKEIEHNRPVYSGYCLDCLEDVEKPKLFCNVECAKNFEVKKKRY